MTDLVTSTLRGKWWARAAVLWIAYKHRPEPFSIADINKEIAAFTPYDRHRVFELAMKMERDHGDAA